MRPTYKTLQQLRDDLAVSLGFGAMGGAQAAAGSDDVHGPASSPLIRPIRKEPGNAGKKPSPRRGETHDSDRR